ncbi:IMPACT family protein [Marinithermus hydrothermalis]|uniref:Uncharacterized protein family UPF0029, Impact, N-terminal protein n=1 Tax=Marinithermus hydrothermalis (strain DSM 14884 / JCM 11576 / T1) TaxID=869210 RepID=F2NP75_MARHT|nr:YigZ family protein [Marinithermus hydrothermalis]AEB11876.1 Uncharacterized protein family UPF0029, Impact, N-terminal protein [Marinithermus hydrothermalis DSM 14884]
MRTIAEPYTYAEEIKKSRFIAHAAPVETPEEAMAFLEAVRDPQATHNCWAYKIGQAYRFSDDGEPGGTAGQPILRAIEGQGLDHVMVVVTRYFGGIKLGAGGLVRAYGGVAATCLRQAPKREVRPQVPVQLSVPFEAMGGVYPVLERFAVTKEAERYTQAGLELALRLDAADLEAFRRALTDATRGKARVWVE